MVCQKCGAQNNNNAKHCINCQHALLPRTPNSQTTQTIFQAPLRQASEPNISTLDQEIDDNTIPLYYQSAPFKQRVDIETVDTKIFEKSATNKRMILWSTIVLLSISMLAMIAFRFMPQNESGASMMYAEAEKIYRSGNYTASLVIFQQYLNEYPKDDLAVMARQRVSEIKTRMQTIKTQQTAQLIERPLKKAREAFAKKKYLTPAEDNVIIYTTEVLKIDPMNIEAMDMRASVVKFYQERAEKALKRRRFKTARRYYENILKIIPGDQNTLRQLEKLKK